MRTTFNYNKNKRLIKNNYYDYTIGIGGYWIQPSYWKSPCAILLLLYILYSLIFYQSIIRYSYTNYLIMMIIYIYFSQEFMNNLQSLITDDKMIRLYIFIVTIIINLVLYALESSIFKYHRRSATSSSSLSLLYSITSSMIIYTCLISTEYHLNLRAVWLTYQLSYSQLSLLLIIQQLINVDRYGITGSISGFIFYYLQQNGMLIN